MAKAFGGQTLTDLKLEIAAPVRDCTVRRETLADLIREAETAAALRALIESVGPAPHLTLDAKWRAEAERLGCRL